MEVDLLFKSHLIIYGYATPVQFVLGLNPRTRCAHSSGSLHLDEDHHYLTITVFTLQEPDFVTAKISLLLTTSRES